MIGYTKKTVHSVTATNFIGATIQSMNPAPGISIIPGSYLIYMNGIAYGNGVTGILFQFNIGLSTSITAFAGGTGSIMASGYQYFGVAGSTYAIASVMVPLIVTTTTSYYCLMQLVSQTISFIPYTATGSCFFSYTRIG